VRLPEDKTGIIYGNVDWLSDLKLRGSYGEVGNQGAIGLYQFSLPTGYGAAINPPDNLISI
jgi:hypothetical protein